MDIKAYISSGIIETYLLGIATPTEIAELEQLRVQYPEVEQAIREAQETLEAFAISNLETPPAHVKDKIWAELGLDTKSKEAAEPETMIIEMPIEKSSPIYRYLAAASVILLLGSLFYNYILMSKVDQLDAHLAMIDAKERLINQELMDTKEHLAIINNPNNKRIRLDGTENFKGNLASVIWDNSNNQVYLQLHQMQSLPSDKQFQLWAIVEGQPVDLGVYQNGTDLQKMKSVEGAQLFAITIEKAGGSPTPTLDQMVVAGPV